MDVLSPVRAFDRFQRRHAVLGVPIAVLRNFSDQEAGNAAALIAYWGFFSIFPLLLLFVTILGFVLNGNPSIERSVVHSALTQFPIIGIHTASLSGNGFALVVGLVGALLSGLGVTLAAENAFNRVYAVPRRDQPNFLVSRWRGLKLLAAMGVLQLLSTVAAGLVSGGLGGLLVSVGGIALSLVLNFCLFSIAFRFLTSRSISTRELLPGILLATIGWEIVQALGGLYVRHVIKGADQTYGTFATVIGLLAWLYLGARIVVYAAEINVVLTRRLWPRSIIDPPEPADRKARAALAKMEERDDKQTVQIEFHAPDHRHGSLALGDPPYAASPAPRRDEHAQPAAPAIAALDLHTTTVEQLLGAIDESLEMSEAHEAVKQRARQWIARTRGQLAGTSRPGHASIEDEVSQALASATRRALGLAPLDARDPSL